MAEDKSNIEREQEGSFAFNCIKLIRVNLFGVY